jgi:hypothetical protein
MMLLLIAGALLMTSCGSSEGGRAQPGDPGEGTPSSTPSTTEGSAQTPTTGPLRPATPSPSLSPQPPPPPGGSPADVPPPLLDQVLADAAQRAGVARSDVQVVSSTAQTWNDGSLGCPKPGESYIQVMVDGYQIIVQAGGHSYDYRTSQNGFKLCEK